MAQLAPINMSVSNKQKLIYTGGAHVKNSAFTVLQNPGIDAYIQINAPLGPTYNLKYASAIQLPYVIDNIYLSNSATSSTELVLDVGPTTIPFAPSGLQTVIAVKTIFSEISIVAGYTPPVAGYLRGLVIGDGATVPQLRYTAASGGYQNFNLNGGTAVGSGDLLLVDKLPIDPTQTVSVVSLGTVQWVAWQFVSGD